MRPALVRTFLCAYFCARNRHLSSLEAEKYGKHPADPRFGYGAGSKS